MSDRLSWLGGTIIAYSVGITAATLFVPEVARPLGSLAGGVVFVAIFGAVIGAGVALMQSVRLRGRGVHPVSWFALTILGAAVGMVAAAFVGEYLGGVISPTGNIVIGGGTIQGASGAALGLGIAIGQYVVLRRAGVASRAWIVATAIGAALGYSGAAGALDVLEIPLLRASMIPAFGATVGLFVGLGQVIALRRR